MRKIKKKVKKLIIHQQWIEVNKKNGEYVSTFYPPNDEFEQMRQEMDPPPDLIYRRMNFTHGVPEPYNWTDPSTMERTLGGHALQRLKPEDWLTVMQEEKASGSLHAISGPHQPRPEQFGPCPCARCTAKRDAQRHQDAA